MMNDTSTLKPQASPWAKHWDLDDSVHFLNHGSFGACPREVRAEQRRWQDRMESQPVRFLAREIERHLDEVRDVLGSFLGTHADNLALVPNATSGVNTVLRGLAFGPADEIIVTNHEYNACRNTVDMAAGRAGAQVVLAPVSCPIQGPEDVVRAIEEKVTDRTQLVLIDQVTSATGVVFPVEEICRAMAKHNVDVMVDGAHAPGMLPLNLDTMGAAYWTGNCHKWLCTPKGSAVLFVRPDRQVGLRPLVISHGANLPRDDRSRFRLEHDWTGTTDPSAWLSVPKGIEFLRRLMPGGFEELRQHNHDLVVNGRRNILNTLERIQKERGTSEIARSVSRVDAGVLADTPVADAREGQSLGTSFLPGEDALQAALRERHQLELPISYWPGLERRTLRISGQAYNEPRQYERLAEALWIEKELV